MTRGIMSTEHTALYTVTNGIPVGAIRKWGAGLHVCLQWDNIEPRPEWFPEGEVHLPDHATVETWVFDSMCEALDGCTVEHDGTCPHGAPSWLMVLQLT